MSYYGSCCRECSKGRMCRARGLGQTDADFYGQRDFLIQMLNGVNARVAGLADTAPVLRIRGKISDAARWLQASLERFYGGNTPAAIESITVGVRTLHEASAMINALRPEDKIAAAAQAKAQAGASFSYQVGERVGELTAPIRSVITEPLATVVEQVSPAAAAAVRSSGWLLPVAGGITLFLLLRR